MIISKEAYEQLDNEVALMPYPERYKGETLAKVFLTLAKYDKDGRVNICAGHDCLWARPRRWKSFYMDEEDIRFIISAGWGWDSDVDSWRKYV